MYATRQLGGNCKVDINKFDKDFAEKREGGFKWWFRYVMSWVCAAIAWFFAILGIIWQANDTSQGGYISLLTVLFSLFGIQYVFKCKTFSWNLRLVLPLIVNGVALAMAFFILYLYMPYLAK